VERPTNPCLIWSRAFAISDEAGSLRPEAAARLPVELRLERSSALLQVAECCGEIVDFCSLADGEAGEIREKRRVCS
jgi:hypothetical protein